MTDISSLLTPSWQQLACAVDHLAAQYKHLASEGLSGELPPNNVIAILCQSSIRLAILELALQKLGLAVLLLSENNSPAAVAQLCKVTKATHLIVDDDMEEKGREATKLMAEENKEIPLVKRVKFQLWPNTTEWKKFEPLVKGERSQDRIALILHSSGTVRTVFLRCTVGASELIRMLDNRLASPNL